MYIRPIYVNILFNKLPHSHIIQSSDSRHEVIWISFLSTRCLMEQNTIGQSLVASPPWDQWIFQVPVKGGIGSI